MLEHLHRIVAVVISTIVASMPALLADPGVRHLVAVHPWLAAYYPLASAALYALYRVVRPSSALTIVSAPPSAGSPTMGART